MLQKKLLLALCATLLGASCLLLCACSNKTVEDDYDVLGISEPVENSTWLGANEQDFADGAEYMSSVVAQLDCSISSASFSLDEDSSCINVYMTTQEEESQSLAIASDAQIICRVFSYAVAAAHLSTLEASVENGELSEDEVAEEMAAWDLVEHDEYLILEQLASLQTSSSTQEESTAVSNYEELSESLKESSKSGGLFDAFDFSVRVSSSEGSFFIVGDRFAGTDNNWFWQ